jgi:hypothetical protein
MPFRQREMRGSHVPDLVLEISERNNRWNKLALEEAEKEKLVVLSEGRTTSIPEHAPREDQNANRCDPPSRPDR